MAKHSIICLLFILLALFGLNQGRKRSRQKTHETRSCGSSGTRCTCDDRAFEVIYGLDDPSYSPRQDIYKYGADVWCFDYIVARTDDPSSRCLDEDLNHIVISVDPKYQGCGEVSCSTYRTMVVDAGCKCTCSKCCTTALGYDAETGQSGIKYSFSRPIKYDADEMEIYLCVRNVRDTQPGLVAYFGVGTYAYSCDHYDVPAFCKGPGGPLDECDDQEKCVDVEIREIASYTPYGDRTYEVCFGWDKGNALCTKQDGISHACPDPSEADKVEMWSSGNKMCKSVPCGSIAQFGVKDGSGCSGYYGTLQTKINGYTATCQYTGGYCGGGNSGDCTWSFPVPQCTPQPTQPTPRPTMPTPRPTQPTPQPTDGYEECDCYETNIYDDNDLYKIQQYENGYVAGEERYKYCYVWLMQQKVRGSYAPVTCRGTLKGVLLGVCSDPSFDLDSLVVSYIGCDKLYAKNDEDLNLYGLYCDIFVDDDFDPNGKQNEIITVCLTRPFNKYPYFDYVGYYQGDGDEFKCGQRKDGYPYNNEGAPDLCTTETPTNDPTDIPTSNPSSDPTKAPTTDPTTDPTKSPTTDPTAFPTYNPTEDPTRNPTSSPIECQCPAITNKLMTLDAIFVVDKSCKSTDDIDYCSLRQYMIAELMTKIKGVDYGRDENIGSRVAYIEFGEKYENVMIQIELNDYHYNTGPVLPANLINYYRDIRDNKCGLSQVPSGQTDLESALDIAISKLRTDGRPDADKKIIVFSECQNTPTPSEQEPEIKDICSEGPGSLKDRITDQTDGIDVIFVNLGFETSQNYGACLANPDEVWEYPKFPDSPTPKDIVDDVFEDICEQPTPSPTTDPSQSPSSDPTQSPSSDPSQSPSTDPSVSPTTDPSVSPTTDPTESPSTDPTLNPTKAPTIIPTKSPISQVCEEFRTGSRHADLVVLNDISRNIEYNDECDFYYKGPVAVIDDNQLKQRVGKNQVRIHEVMEITMDVHVNSACSAECSVLRIGELEDEKYPLIQLRPDTDNDGMADIQIKFNTDNGGEEIKIAQNVLPINDAPQVTHRIYLVWSTERLTITLDGTEILNVEGEFSHRVDLTEYLDDNTDKDDDDVFRLKVYAGDDQPADVTISNLCIKTSWSPSWDKDSPTDCFAKQNFIAEAFTLLKGDESVDLGEPLKNVRYSYIEFDANGPNVIIPFSDPINSSPVDSTDLLNEYRMVQGRDCSSNTNDVTNLCAALDAAFNQFTVAGNNGSSSFTPERERKIIIVSNNNMANDECLDGRDICTEYEKLMYGRDVGDNGSGVSVVMVNLDMDGVVTDTYLPCLVYNDNQRIMDIVTDPDLLDPDTREDVHINNIKNKLCTYDPSPSPTTDPTTDPTKSPSTDPTLSPSTDPSKSPSTDPTLSPSSDPTLSPSTDPTTSPSTDPTSSPSTDPTLSPSSDPTVSPSTDPTSSPSTDPTLSPSSDPTVSPSTDPTSSPSTDPTSSPSSDPTVSPSTDPTVSPTTDPTLFPTQSPINKECRLLFDMDVAFLVDNSCGFSETECAQRQEGIFELITGLKNDNTPRLIYVPFSDKKYESIDEDVLVSLNDVRFNDLSMPNGEETAIANFDLLQSIIRDNDCGGSITNPDTNLVTAIEYTINQFAQNVIAGQELRHFKIVIISSCENNEEYDPCRDLSLEDITVKSQREVEFTIINIASAGSAPSNRKTGDNYLYCLTEEDPGRFQPIPDVTEKAFNDILQPFKEEICRQPTEDPTTDPTVSPSSDPTLSPSTDPTKSPSTDPSISPTTDPSKSPSTDPTLSPSTDPTKSPSTDPTKSPTTDPTISPTTDPTLSPSTDPTLSPSTDPTRSPTINPTQSPTRNNCDMEMSLDLVIGVDTSCRMTEKECRAQQEMVAETFTALRGPDIQNIEGRDYFKVRVAYSEFGSNGKYINYVDFFSSPSKDPGLSTGAVNTGDAGQPLLPNPEELNMNFYNYIRSRADEICSPLALSERKGNPSSALDKLLDDIFDLYDDADSTNNQYDRELLLFSNCGVSPSEREDICRKYQDKIRNPLYNKDGRDVGINVNMVNTVPCDKPQDDDDMINPSTYLACLVEYDPDGRIFVNDPPICNDEPTPTIPPHCDDMINRCDFVKDEPSSYYKRDICIGEMLARERFNGEGCVGKPNSMSNVNANDPCCVQTPEPFDDEVIEKVKESVCKEPTPAPTTDPTIDPTRDPTKDPTSDPTKSPSTDPTRSPSTDPTRSPSTDPTLSPSTDPTRSPTTDPTRQPTGSPLQPPCNWGGIETDIVILVDTTDLMNDEDCKNRQKYIAEYFTAIKGAEDPNTGVTAIRVAYLEFNGEEVKPWFNINDVNINYGPFTATERNNVRMNIEGKVCGTTPGGTPKLADAVRAALDQFNAPFEPTSNNLRRDKKIIIFNSKGESNQVTLDNICSMEDEIRSGAPDANRGANQNGKGVNVIIGNFEATESDNLYGPNSSKFDYVLCLVEYDENRIYQYNYNEEDLLSNINGIVIETCDTPSPAPTTDPTIDPTRDPTTDPTSDPTRSPTTDPTTDPTKYPTTDPTKSPSTDPTRSPSTDPTKSPSTDPTKSPSTDPSISPTTDPTRSPSTDPTRSPSTDPTKSPSSDPTRSPSSDPTVSPSTDPSKTPTTDPTRSPTSDPTTDPTRSPTTDPTLDPTRSPQYAWCNMAFEMDVVFLVDHTCSMSAEECEFYFEGVSEYMGSIKGAGSPRFAYIPITDEINPPESYSEPLIKLNDLTYNDLDPANEAAMFENRYFLSQFIADGAQSGGDENSPCIGGFSGTASGKTNLVDAIEAAERHLVESNIDFSPEEARHGKIVIFSRCLHDEDNNAAELDSPCNIKTLRFGRNEIEITVVNVIGDGSGEIDESNAPNYLIYDDRDPANPEKECLVEDDEEGRLVVIERDDVNTTTLVRFFEKIIAFKEEVCEQPTPAPTTDPTVDPTRSPTTDPTKNPTKSPVRENCDDSMTLDFVILADRSCTRTEEQCKKQQAQIAETMTSIRGTEYRTIDGYTASNVRVSYIEFGSDDGNDATSDIQIIIELNDKRNNDPNNGVINDPEARQQALMSLFYEIASGTDICDNVNDGSRNGNPALYEAIGAAIDQFDDGPTTSNNLRTDKKILIFSDCSVDDIERTKICESYEDNIRAGMSNADRGANQAGKGINVVMVNSDSMDANPEEYIMCLVEYGEERTITNPDSPPDDEPYDPTILEPIQDEVCDTPSPAPTTDPTIDPTTDPTTDPTRSPTTDPTRLPTKSPTRENCPLGEMNLDLTFLVDTSCYMTKQECINQQELIAESFTALRGDDLRNIEGRDYFKVRVAYSEYGSDGNINPIIDFFSSPSKGIGLITGAINTGDAGQPLLPNPNEINMDYYNFIRNRAPIICTENALSQRNGNPALDEILDDTINRLYDDSDSTNNQYDREIIIFSNCAANEREKVCEKYEDKIRNPLYSKDGRDVGFNVNMVNTVPCDEPQDDDDMIDPSTYLACLVEYDPDGRIFVNDQEICDNPPTTPTRPPHCDEMIKKCKVDTNLEMSRYYDCEGTTLITDIYEGMGGCTEEPNTSDQTENHECCQPGIPPYPPTEPFDPNVITNVTDSICEEPTPAPTTDPTIDPTRDPTKDPTSDPTISPTTDPTKSPSTDPTRSPTTDPTFKPSESPIHDGCQIGYQLDVVFLVDQSCGMSPAVCTNYLDGVFEYIASIKKYSQPRVAYIDMRSQTVDPFISLEDEDNLFNDLEDMNKFLTTIDSMQIKVRKQDCNKGGFQTPDVADSINKAITEFTNHSPEDRHKKIVIVSNCKHDGSTNVCDTFKNGIYIVDQEVEVTVINIANPTATHPDEQIVDPEQNTYLKCLTENDPTRLLPVPSTDPTDMESIIYDFWNEVCEQPTEAPTTDPTRSPSTDPTLSPSTDPTKSPTTDPTRSPSTDPTLSPTTDPTKSPSTDPTVSPSTDPTRSPSTDPTKSPSTDPTVSPSTDPTKSPSTDPTRSPSTDPTKSPTTDPSVSPTTDPTRSPSTDPTISPTTDPTKSPSTDPTVSPSTDPTRSPTTDPTINPTRVPTKSPTVEMCKLGEREIDVVILNDRSGGFEGNDRKCRKHQDMVADSMTALKQKYNGDNDLPPSRVAYIEFDSDSVTVLVALNKNPINGNSDGAGSSTLVTQQQMNEYTELITDRTCDESMITEDRICDDNNPTMLYQALQKAEYQFVLEPQGSNLQRDRYIVIFSNCKVPQIKREEICSDFEDYIRAGIRNAKRGSNQAAKGINIVMINMGNSFNGEPSGPGDEADDYILCLTEYDDKRIYETSSRNQDDFEEFGLDATIVNEVCTEPSPAPTTDPTIDPTTDPTTDPTKSPSTDPTKSPSTDPTKSPSTDPTLSPSTDPTRSPSTDPTLSPSTDPTRSPSTDPTKSPSTDPTRSPTTDPTFKPTISPLHKWCYEAPILDFIFIIDNTCGYTEDECVVIRESIAEYQQLIKGNTSPRFGLIQMTLSTPNIEISLADTIYNAETLLDPDSLFDARRRQLYQHVATLGCLESQTDSNLAAAIEAARNEFKDNAKDDREEKLVIFSSCTVNTGSYPSETDICNTYGNGIFDGATNAQNPLGNEIEITIVNLRGTENENLPNEYLKCLTGTDKKGYDDRRLFEIHDATDLYDYHSTFDSFHLEICSQPSNAPTTDPTTDPTKSPSTDPTRSPTTDPTTDPTKSPSTDPTRSPSTDPTSSPSSDPTRSPSTDPTTNPSRFPTKSPTQESCDLDGQNIDIVILNDVSGPFDGKASKCRKHQDMVADTLTRLKGTYYGFGELPDSRVAYIEFGKQTEANNGINVIRSLDYNPTNVNSNGANGASEVTPEMIMEYSNLVEDRCNDETNESLENRQCDSDMTNLYGALQAAEAQFSLETQGSNKQRDRYIVIFSDCRVSDDSRIDICRDFEDYIRSGIRNAKRGANQADKGINVVMINMGNSFNGDADDYILCLTEYDDKRIYQTSSRDKQDFDTQGLEATIVNEVCTEPSPAPTTDPTIDPTTDPTTDPTKSPSTDPTKSPSTDPTRSPTTDPTTDPTKSPSTDPTPSPSTDPTKSPSTDPTRSPTTDPTKQPTPSPNMPACNVRDLDVVFLVDVSCEMIESQCDEQQEFIAELMTAIKGTNNNVRVAYIEYGANNKIDIEVDLARYLFNDPLPPPQGEINAIYNVIRARQCSYSDFIGDPQSLDNALQAAYNQFDNVGASDLNGRDKKIIIFSHCYLNTVEQKDIVNNNYEKIRTGLDDPERSDSPFNGIDVVMVNLGSSPSNYIAGLVEYDLNRIFNEGNVNYDDALSLIVQPIADQICKEPSSAPTTDPTIDPTTDPTTDPTKSPSTDPTRSPSTDPTKSPSTDPTVSPTTDPSKSPSTDPTKSPSTDPTVSPSTDPSKSPSTDPTVSPSTDPTSSPSTDPSKSPSSDPTVSPTTDPTRSPTTDPTLQPTPSPTRENCEVKDMRLDLVIAVDTSCAMTERECRNQQYMAAETFTAVRGEDLLEIEGIDYFQVRVAYVEYGTSGTEYSYFNEIHFFTAPRDGFGGANTGKNQPGEQHLIHPNQINMDYYNYIMHRVDVICTGPRLSERAGNPDLSTTIDNAFILYDDADSTNNQYDREMLIFSNCAVNDRKKVCEDYENQIRNPLYSKDGRDVGVNVNMVNTVPCDEPQGDDDMIDPSTYLACLVEYDPDGRIFVNDQCDNPPYSFDPNVITNVTKSICNEPTPAPTTDPTIDPTRDPTTDPTLSPTTDPTLSPSSDPTVSPSTDPTVSPTVIPTKSPIVGVCQELTSNPDRRLDVIVIVDNSADLGNATRKECSRQQEFISELISSFKGEEESDGNDDGLPQVRVGYYIFGTEGVPTGLLTGNEFDRIISLNDVDLNQLPVEMGTYLTGLYYRIRDMDCGDSPAQSTTNLYDALDDAIAHFNDAGVESDTNGRDKKIVIVSNRANTKGDICADFEQRLKPNNGIDIVMINIPKDRTSASDPESDTPFGVGMNVANGNGYWQPDLYNLCLTNNGKDRIIGLERNRILRDVAAKDDILDIVQNEVCSEPSNSPTTDPTSDPTKSPSTDPTRSPTTDPTSKPTRSPIVCDCGAGYNMDLTFLIDISCIPDSQCNAYSEGIAELFSAIKGEFALPRISIVTFDGYSVNTIVSLNSSEYNSFLSRTGYRIGLEKKTQFYNEIRDIKCNGNGNSGETSADQTTDVMSAMQAAFDAFDYEETVYLPSVSDYRSDYTGRDKKVVLFSTCLNSGGSGGEEAVCSAYSDEANRIIDGLEVEITVFNALTTTTNLQYNQYWECLTENDEGRRYFAGRGGRGGLVLDDMTSKIECFKREICDEPSPAPTTDPTPSPTDPPTTDPTDMPTSQPTTDPTRRPTDPPIPRCTCDHLGWRLRYDSNDCPDGTVMTCHGCTPYGPCDYSPNCYTYSVISKDPKQCKTDCKYYDFTSLSWKPHKPAYIIVPHRDDCPVFMGQFQYWNVVEKVTDAAGDQIAGYEELYDDQQDAMTDDSVGVKIPIQQFYDDVFTFRMCLFGVTGFIPAQQLNIGWAYKILASGYDYTGTEYGFACPSMVEIPDLCEDKVAYARIEGNGQGNVDNNQPNDNQPNTDNNNNNNNKPIDLLVPGSKKHINNNTPKSIFTLYSAYSLWIFAAIVTIFALNIFVCTYIKCIRGKTTNSNKKSYGFISNKADESDNSDGTDSEFDSESDDVEKLIE